MEPAPLEIYIGRVNDQNGIYRMILTSNDRPDDDFHFCDIAFLKSHLPGINKAGLSLLPSQLGALADLGVFCSGRAFKQDEIVTYYHGKVYTHADFQRVADAKHSHARYLIRNAYMLVGNENERGELVTEPERVFDGLGAGAYINHAPTRANVEYYPIDNTENQIRVQETRYADESDHAFRERTALLAENRIIGMRALRDIAQGEELYANYGPGYNEYGERYGYDRQDRRDERNNPFRKKQKLMGCLCCGEDERPLMREADTGAYFCDQRCQSEYHGM